MQRSHQYCGQNNTRQQAENIFSERGDGVRKGGGKLGTRRWGSGLYEKTCGGDVLCRNTIVQPFHPHLHDGALEMGSGHNSFALDLF